ncbi:MAG TPA: PAS domain S-box protein [Gemmatimonadaceae bacterium]|nr:PAS domain S-box protein [Gemmatimonadaceae bacterium]
MDRSTQFDSRFEALAESAPDAILTIDEDSTILFANTAVERVFGYAPGELTGKPLHVLIPERLRAAHDRGLSRYLKTGRKNIPWTGVALDGLRKDGSEIPVEISFGEFLDEYGVRAFSGFVRDISDRVRARRELEAAHARAESALRDLRRLSRVLDVAMAQGTYVDMLQQLMRALREELSADEATALILDEQENALVVGASDDIRPGETDDGKAVAFGEGVAGRVAATAQPLVIDDMSTVAYASARLAGLGSLIAVPIISERRVIGVLHAGALERGHFRSEDLHLFQVVAERVAGVFARARLYKELRHRQDQARKDAEDEYALRVLAQGITGAVQIADVMHQTVTGAVAVTGVTAAYIEQVINQRGEVEIVAISGRPTPEVGLRVPYPGSLTEEIIKQGDPVFVVKMEGMGIAMAPYLARSCSDCSALVVPIMAGDRVLGSLVLLKPEGEPRFDDNVVNRVRTLGELASLSLQRLIALSESERRRAEAEQAVRSRDEVLSVVSHDLRNPVGTVSMAASLLRDTEIPLTEDQRATQLDIISRSAQRMNRLIQDLLDVARMEGKRFTVVRRCEDAAALGREACDSFAVIVRSKNQTLECHVPPVLPRIFVDRDRVLQALSNFLNNAVKFTPAGGRISIDATSAGGCVRYTVRDSGPGIEAEDLAHVFARFWQSKRTAHMGSGLGLAIARGVAEAHGGRVFAESEVGAGSTFSIEFPITPDCAAS